MLENDSTTIRAGGRVVGEVQEGKFVKRLKASRHQLRAPGAWAFDVESLQSAIDHGASFVEIVDVESGTTYSTSVGRILDQGFKFNRGHGVQIALTMKYWTVRRPGEAEQLAFALA